MEFIDPRLCTISPATDDGAQWWNDTTNGTDSFNPLSRPEFAIMDSDYELPVGWWDPSICHCPYPPLQSAYPEGPLMVNTHYQNHYSVDPYLPRLDYSGMTPAMYGGYQMGFPQGNPYLPPAQHAAPAPAPAPAPVPDFDAITHCEDEIVVATSPTGKAKRSSSRKSSKSARSSRRTRSSSKAADISLSKPFSQLALENPNVAIIDMEAFVRRGPSERVDKTGVSKGRVLRPLNPFMLYRKAYGDLAKVVLGTNQRQMLSRYVGVSWGLEDESVLRQFRKLAEAENEAHRQLFPGWKYLRGYPLKKTD